MARDCTSADATGSQGPRAGGWGSGGNSYGGSGGRECYKCGGRGHMARFVS